MRIYRFKDKLTKREAFYGNLKLLLKREPIYDGAMLRKYHYVYSRLRKEDVFETNRVRITRENLIRKNTK